MQATSRASTAERTQADQAVRNILGRSSAPPDFPAVGFVRQRQIIGDRKAGIAGVLPFGPSKWWDGIRAGIYPAPIRHGHITMWRAEDIRALIERIESEGAPATSAPATKGTKLAELRSQKRRTDPPKSERSE